MFRATAGDTGNRELIKVITTNLFHVRLASVSAKLNICVEGGFFFSVLESYDLRKKSAY